MLVLIVMVMVVCDAVALAITEVAAAADASLTTAAVAVAAAVVGGRVEEIREQADRGCGWRLGRFRRWGRGRRGGGLTDGGSGKLGSE